MVEPGAIAADVLRRRKCRSEKAGWQDVSPPCPVVHDPRAGTVRACTRRRLPASSRYTPEKRSVLEHRLGRPSLSGQYASYRGSECRLPVGVGERGFRQRIYPSQWRSPTDNAFRRVLRSVVKPCWTETFSCELSGRQQTNSSGIHREKR